MQLCCCEYSLWTLTTFALRFASELISSSIFLLRFYSVAYQSIGFFVHPLLGINWRCVLEHLLSLLNTSYEKLTNGWSVHGFPSCSCILFKPSIDMRWMWNLNKRKRRGEMLCRHMIVKKLHWINFQCWNILYQNKKLKVKPICRNYRYLKIWVHRRWGEMKPVKQGLGFGATGELHRPHPCHCVLLAPAMRYLMPMLLQCRQISCPILLESAALRRRFVH